MNRRVVITGLGVISSIGTGWREFWEGLLMGKSGISPVTSFDTREHFTHMGGEVRGFDAEAFLPRERLPSLNRGTQMAVAAARLAMEDSGLGPEDLQRLTVGVSMGTTMGSVQSVETIDELIINEKIPLLPGDLICQVPTHSTPSAVARELGLRGPGMMFSTACAAGNYAIGCGFDMIRFSRADIVIAGASDPFSKVAFTGFNQLGAVAPERCQPFDQNRKGMMVAEGAGVLVLESLESAMGRKAAVYAEVGGYGLSCDAQHMTQPSAEGVAECMRKALREAGLRAEDVDYISAHGTGTRANDSTECAAIKEVFGPIGRKVPVSSIKSMLGHAMGAASALEAIACALAVKNDVIPPTMNFETPDPECSIDCVPNQSRRQRVSVALNNSYAFGGNNASLVLRKFNG
jgi:3-oxoacyl-[acyl-carrier-protein] synthase II